jgi:(R)-2-hydroxyacyl-CoA dehydratese activating ATPase
MKTLNPPQAPLIEDKNQRYYWGVDCGSSAIKIVVCDEQGNILLQRKTKTLFPLQQHIKKALVGDGSFSPFEEHSDSDNSSASGDNEASVKVKANHQLAATGYGRHHIAYIDNVLTEIKAHFLGVQKQLNIEQPFTIIDIGGQDAKVISVNVNRVDQFAINRKCAAGTGAFIEELAHRLEVPMEKMTELAAQHDKELTLNSYCTVFSAQEVIKILMKGEKVANLIYALYRSVVKRVLEMTAINTDVVVFSGGVMSFHPLLLSLFSQQFSASNAAADKTLIMAPNTQFCGAYGAAVHALALDTNTS